MKRIIVALLAFLLATTAGYCQYIPPSGGGGGGSSTPSPFVPAGFANVSTMNGWKDLIVSPDGAYVYVAGRLTSNSDAAIAKVKVADGTVSGTFEISDGGAANGIGYLAISPGGTHLYACYSLNSGVDTFVDVATSSMTAAHTKDLTPATLNPNTQCFDLSPDGSTYAYVTAGDAKLYMINTSTYAVTSQTMNHTAGDLTSVCFYNGSNTDVYVAHAGSADVDKYVIGGAYVSTVSTGAGGTPAFNAMRSGINGNFYIADSGTDKEVIQVHSGTPTIHSVNGTPSALTVDTLSTLAVNGGFDACFFVANGINIFVLDPNHFTYMASISQPESLGTEGFSGLAVFPDSSRRLFTLSGQNSPEVWSLPSVGTTLDGVGPAGTVATSEGKGNLLTIAPYSTSGFTGSGTIGGGGSVTITTAVATSSSVINVTNTSATPHALSVSTKNNGSFVVSGTAADTFDWVVTKP